MNQVFGSLDYYLVTWYLELRTGFLLQLTAWNSELIVLLQLTTQNLQLVSLATISTKGEISWKTE
ncbi:hypothetical protein V512_009725 [Mesotoga sp. Brook.08.105.5.1]|nr:hypothetical protein V512_009725 [Mesotoga sp. Brook.08.105.5.1]